MKTSKRDRSDIEVESSNWHQLKSRLNCSDIEVEALRGRVHKRPAGAPNAVMHAVDVAGLKSDGPFCKRLTKPAWVGKPSPEPWSTNMCSLWLLGSVCSDTFAFSYIGSYKILSHSFGSPM